MCLHGKIFCCNCPRCFLAGEHDGNYLLSDLEFEHEPFSGCNFDLKLKDDYGNDSFSRSTVLLR